MKLRKHVTKALTASVEDCNLLAPQIPTRLSESLGQHSDLTKSKYSQKYFIIFLDVEGDCAENRSERGEKLERGKLRSLKLTSPVLSCAQFVFASMLYLSFALK